MDTAHQGCGARAVRPADRGREGTARSGRPSRTDLQNRFLHALLNDIADQVPWPKDTGEVRSALWWKRRCTLQWMIDKKMPFEIITPLYHRQGDEEEIGLLLPHTSDLTPAQCSELTEWIISFGATNGVAFKNPRWPA